MVVGAADFDTIAVDPAHRALRGDEGSLASLRYSAARIQEEMFYQLRPGVPAVLTHPTRLGAVGKSGYPAPTAVDCVERVLRQP